MTHHLFSHQNLQISYIQWGEGEEVLLCFPGFGRPASDFNLFQPLLLPHQRMIAIDLIAHEQSTILGAIPGIQSLPPDSWIAFLEAFLKDKGIERFHLIGYSMGGRIALCTWEWMPQYVNSILLLAPDGLKKNMMYRFTSGTLIGRSLYKYFIQQPKILFAAAALLHRVKILHPKLFRFVHVHLDTITKRQQVYDSWIAYRQFFPNLKNLGQSHRKSMIPLVLIFGDNDSIIKPKLANRMKRHFSTPFTILLLEAGHRLLNNDLIQLIQSKNLWPGKRLSH